MTQAVSRFINVGERTNVTGSAMFKRASAGHDFKSNSALLESTILRLKQEAAQLGANGIILSQVKERDTPKTTINLGSAQATNSTGSSTYVNSNIVSVDRGDSYTRINGLAIFVKK